MLCEKGALCVDLLSSALLVASECSRKLHGKAVKPEEILRRPEEE